MIDKIKRSLILSVLFPCFYIHHGYCQEFSDTISTDHLTLDDAFLFEMKCLMDYPYGLESVQRREANLYYEDKDSIPVFSDSIYKLRIEKLDKSTPIELQFNADVLSYIKFYVNRRRSFTKRALGRSAYYFPIFEEKLDQHQMPFELKYLPVIESALNPKARSRAGAVGLWQFMYRTARGYDLTINSVVDQRKDPLIATEAACKHLKYLYGLYHDWALVLAAYNAGEGNVNKAIRRAGGGKKTYWQIRKFLPRETRGYVPSFIAVVYAMTYKDVHNLEGNEFILKELQVDTIQISNTTALQNISDYLEISMEELEYMNPSYNRGRIQTNKEKAHIYVPVGKVSDFFVHRDSIYTTELSPLKEQQYTHVVKNGEYLGVIASHYNCTVSQIKEWNGLGSDRLRIGQKLIIYSKN